MVIIAGHGVSGGYFAAGRSLGSPGPFQAETRRVLPGVFCSVGVIHTESGAPISVAALHGYRCFTASFLVQDGSVDVKRGGP